MDGRLYRSSTWWALARALNRSCWRRRSAPTSFSGLPPPRSRRGGLTAKVSTAFRAWAGTQLVRRPPPVVLALTPIDELRPVNQWAPPYDFVMPGSAKARAIRDAVDAVARALALPVNAIVPVAMPPGRQSYNLDALWARIAIDLDEAKLVQLDRLRLGQQPLNLRELANQFGRSGRIIIKGIVTS